MLLPSWALEGGLRRLAGKTLGDVIGLRNLERSLHGAAEAAFWLVEQGGCGGVFHAISEEDVLRIMRHPASMIASDGDVIVFGRAHPHPRSYGTFAPVLGVYVREQEVLTLEEAVRKMAASWKRVGSRPRARGGSCTARRSGDARSRACAGR